MKIPLKSTFIQVLLLRNMLRSFFKILHVIDILSHTKQKAIMYILLPVLQTYVPRCRLMVNVYWTLFLFSFFYQCSKNYFIRFFVIHSSHAGEKCSEFCLACSKPSAVKSLKSWSILSLFLFHFLMYIIPVVSVIFESYVFATSPYYWLMPSNEMAD